MRPSFLSSLVVLGIASASLAEDTYTVRFKLSVDVGRSATVTMVSRQSGGFRAYGGDGKLLLERTGESEDIRYRYTVLERDKDANAVKFARTYETAKKTVDGKEKGRSYADRTLLFEEVAGKHRIGVSAGPALDPEDVAELFRNQKGASATHALLEGLNPGKPVRVGDSWSMPITAVFKDAMTADVSKSALTAKLVKVYPKGQSTFGTFEVTARLRITALHDGGVTIPFDPPAACDGKLVFDLAIDGSSSESADRGELTIKGEGRVKVGDDTRRVVVDLRQTGRTEYSAEVDDPKARVVPKVTPLPAPGEWAAFKAEGGLFTAEFPGQPIPVTEKDPGYRLHTWEVETEDHAANYVVRVAEFANPEAVDPAAVLKEVVSRTKNVRGQTDVEIAGVKGLELRFTAEVAGRTFEYRQRVAVTKQRSVQVIAAHVSGKPGEADRFFKSFRMDWAAKAPATAWAEYKAPGGMFVALFPNPPTAETTNGPGYTQRTWTGADDGVTYIIRITDYEALAAGDPATALKNVVADLKGRSKKEIEINGVKGVEVVYEREVGAKKVEYVHRIAMTATRGIEVFAGASGKKPDDQFFRSFRSDWKAKPKDE
jgi:hypothetical protein